MREIGGRYCPFSSSVWVYCEVPPSLSVLFSEYESEGVKMIKKVAPGEWKKAQYLLREIIVYPCYAPPNSQDEKEREKSLKE